MPPADSDVCASPKAVLIDLLRDPGTLLLRRWNWKSALLSGLFRAFLFLAANATAGPRAALGAAAAEMAYRLVTAGFYGAMTQSFRRAEPAWAAALTASVLVPVLSHSLEFLVHLARGTPNLRASLAASAGFTVISTLFNSFAMRRGVLLVGEGAAPIADDLRRMLRLVADFLAAGARSSVKHLSEKMF